MKKPLSTPLPADLPQNWTDTQFVSPGGVEVGLSEKHGYNYLSKQINEAQKAINALNEAFEKVLALDGSDSMIGRLWLASRLGVINAGEQGVAMRANNSADDENNGRTLRIKNSSSANGSYYGALERSVQLDDVIDGTVASYFLFGQHNKALANREILLKGLDAAPSSDTPGDYPEGVHLYLQTPGGQLKNAPSEYGLMLSMKHNDELTQLWFTQASGTTYRRGGNHLGWASSWTPLSEGVMPATIEE